MNIPNASPFSFPLESGAGTPDSPYLMFIGFVVRNPVTDKHTVKYRSCQVEAVALTKNRKQPT